MEKFKDVHKKHNNDLDMSKPSMAVDNSLEEIKAGHKKRNISPVMPLNDGERSYPANDKNEGKESL